MDNTTYQYKPPKLSFLWKSGKINRKMFANACNDDGTCTSFFLVFENLFLVKSTFTRATGI